MDIGRQETSFCQYLLCARCFTYIFSFTPNYYSTKVVLLLPFSIRRSETQKVTNRPKVMYLGLGFGPRLLSLWHTRVICDSACDIETF